MTWLQLLEDLRWIVLFADGLQLLVVDAAVRLKHLLLDGSVVLVDEWVVQSASLGCSSAAVDGVAGSGHDGGIVFSTGVLDGKVDEVEWALADINAQSVTAVLSPELGHVHWDWLVDDGVGDRWNILDRLVFLEVDGVHLLDEFLVGDDSEGPVGLAEAVWRGGVDLLGEAWQLIETKSVSNLDARDGGKLVQDLWESHWLSVLNEGVDQVALSGRGPEEGGDGLCIAVVGHVVGHIDESVCKLVLNTIVEEVGLRSTPNLSLLKGVELQLGDNAKVVTTTTKSPVKISETATSLGVSDGTIGQDDLVFNNIVAGPSVRGGDVGNTTTKGEAASTDSGGTATNDGQSELGELALKEA